MQNLQQTVFKTVETKGRTIKGWTIRLALGLAMGAALVASPAAAGGPTRSEVVFTYSSVLTGFCEFDVSMSGALAGTETDMYDRSGALTKSTVHGLAQDTFWANGKTLVGTLFAVNVQLLFDSNGNLTNFFGNGITERVRLPDGSLFIAAGRVDLVNYPNMVTITPDHGGTVNLAGFCAALAP